MPKMDSLKDFITPSPKKFFHTQIDLDITNLTISDVMRNINTLYPKNTYDREKISSGDYVLGILCKSEYLNPLKGLMIFIISDNIDVNISSQKYAVICINEKDISSETKIMNVNDSVSVYLSKNYKDYIDDFNLFYNRYLYNAYEYESEE